MMQLNRRILGGLIGSVLVGVLAACGASQTTQAPTGSTSAAPTASTGVSTNHGGGVHGDTTTGDAPFDALFIDGMTEHHRGAITMAEQALKESQRPELRQMAQNIVTSQQQEIDQMANWRKQWYPNLAPTDGIGMDMGTMEISPDTSKPFEARFIDAMISHHNGAIEMAKEAQTKAEHSEIKTLAEAIIKAQETEVTQMRQWQSEWFK
jgi:uncharacterized protein (DUF305 family)